MPVQAVIVAVPGRRSGSAFFQKGGTQAETQQSTLSGAAGADDGGMALVGGRPRSCASYPSSYALFGLLYGWSACSFADPRDSRALFVGDS